MKLKSLYSLVAIALLFPFCLPIESNSSSMNEILLLRAVLNESPADASEQPEQTIDLGDPVPTLIAGTIHTCFLNAAGNVTCWGNSGNGQTGRGSQASIGDDELPSSVGSIPLPQQAVRLAGRDSHTCALLRNGDLYCWGLGSDGRLGYGDELSKGDNELPTAPGPVPVGLRVDQVVAGVDHTCVLLEDRRVICWGSGAGGKLGYGNTDNLLSASHGNTVTIPEQPVSLSTGSHTCTLTDTGSVRCWGGGFAGRLGYGNENSIGDDELPDTVGFVPLIGTVSSIDTARQHSCVLYTDQTISCWGNGARGRLGYGNTNRIGDDEVASAAGTVNVGGAVEQISTGYEHTCAILTGGSVVCWGEGGNGRLGYGNTDDIGDNELPAAAGAISLPGPAVQIAAGGRHTCALLQSDEIYCWGEGGSGQLGYGNTITIGDDEPADSGGPVSYQ